MTNTRGATLVTPRGGVLVTAGGAQRCDCCGPWRRLYECGGVGVGDPGPATDFYVQAAYMSAGESGTHAGKCMIACGNTVATLPEGATVVAPTIDGCCPPYPVGVTLAGVDAAMCTDCLRINGPNVWYRILGVAVDGYYEVNIPGCSNFLSTSLGQTFTWQSHGTSFVCGAPGNITVASLRLELAASRDTGVFSVRVRTVSGDRAFDGGSPVPFGSHQSNAAECVSFGGITASSGGTALAVLL